MDLNNKKKAYTQQRTVIRNILILIFSFLYSLSNAQEMKSYLNKELIANVGSIFEETPDDNPCAGSEIYLTLLFDKEKVCVTEKEISSCGKEFITEIGKYNWELVSNKEISINFDPQKTKNTYAQNLFLQIKNHNIIGKIRHLNGEIIEYPFKDK